MWVHIDSSAALPGEKDVFKWLIATFSENVNWI